MLHFDPEHAGFEAMQFSIKVSQFVVIFCVKVAFFKLR